MLWIAIDREKVELLLLPRCIGSQPAPTLIGAPLPIVHKVLRLVADVGKMKVSHIRHTSYIFTPLFVGESRAVL